MQIQSQIAKSAASNIQLIFINNSHQAEAIKHPANYNAVKYQFQTNHFREQTALQNPLSSGSSAVN